VPHSFDAVEVFYGCRRTHPEELTIGNIGWPALYEKRSCRFNTAHPVRTPDLIGSTRLVRKVGPGFVYWIDRVTPDCVLDAPIAITIGTESPD
jgi:hypothetical protein